MSSVIIRGTGDSAAGREEAGGPQVEPTWLLITGVTLLIVTVAVERLVLGLPLHGDRAADLSWRGLGRVAAIAAAVFCLTGALLAWARTRDRVACLDIDLWPRSVPARIGLVATFAAGASSALVLALSPTLFHEGAMEDGIAEWLSAWLLFLASVSCAVLAARQWTALGRRGVIVPALALLAAGHFVLAGEEVSWLQRVLNISTPEAFRNNAQGELNLHNFATRWAEIAFYVGAGFVFPVLVPVWMSLRLPLGLLRRLAPLAPGAYLIGPAAVIAAFNVNRWNWLATQATFWGCVAVLGMLAIGGPRPSQRIHAVVVLVCMACIQAVFLVAGSNSLRGWDVTEYKEMLIAAVLFMYCVSLWRLDVER